MTDNPSSPRWLNADQEAAWNELLGVLIWLPVALDTQLQNDADLSHFEYQVLARLSAAPEHTLSMLELAAATNASPSRLSHAAGRLERQGWVTRSPAPENRRYIRAALTEEGYAKLVATAPGHVESVQQHVFDQLDPSQVRDLAKIAGAIRAAVAPG